MIKEKGLSDKVFFLGFIKNSDLPNYLALADGYLTASLSDSTPVALLEAMSCGLVPIVSDIDGHKEWVNLKNGFMFNKHSKEDLTKKIEQFLRLSKQEINKIKEHNINLIGRRGNEDIEMNKLEKIYQSLK